MSKPQRTSPDRGASRVPNVEIPSNKASFPRIGRAWWSVTVLSLLGCFWLLDRQIMDLLVPDIRS